MKFNDFLQKNRELDKEKGNYTRYLVDYNEKLDEQILVALSTDKGGNAEVSVYITDLDVSIKLKKALDNSCAGKSNEVILNECINGDQSFEVSDNPIAVLGASVFGKEAVVDMLNVKSDYCRKGIGSYLLNVIQDYYKKTNHIGDKYGNKKLYVDRNTISDELYYANALERKTGSVGSCVAYIKAKVVGSRKEQAVACFLDKNNFRVTSHPYDMPRKFILSDRTIISEELLDEENKLQVIQCGSSVLALSDEEMHR